MDNEIITKRRLIIILVVATVLIFIALVWLVATALPWGRLDSQVTATSGVFVSRDCTRPVGYWKDHPELFPAQVIIGGVVYQERELEALLSDDSQELSQQLRVQLAVAFMNNQAGADQGSIEGTLFKAFEWLVNHPAGTQVSGSELAVGQQLYEQLDAFNLGLGGVVACETVFSVTKTATQTTSVTTEIILISSTPTPSMTPTTTGVGTALATAIPTTQIPILASWTPSQPPQQNPTNTPIHTIQAPTRTYTPKPPTPTNTPEPPTATNTPEPPTPTFPPEDTPTPTFPPAIAP